MNKSAAKKKSSVVVKDLRLEDKDKDLKVEDKDKETDLSLEQGQTVVVRGQGQGQVGLPVISDIRK